jgi:hypothetical protein
MRKQKIQPHCTVCEKPFKRLDKVLTDTMCTQIFHQECFIYYPKYIKDYGTYEEIVNKYPEYKRTFIVTDHPIPSLPFNPTLLH